ncbi:T9SS C-terminal target domain-containing protein [Bacteroidia bacterium]|nr:T9SS C-terminal target domain-containing protein [Bacteroidia bacterium]
MLFTVSLFSFQVKADVVVIGGIAYNLDDEKLTAETAQLPRTNPDVLVPYTGDLVIPASVTNGGKTYAVKKIGNNSLRDSPELKSVTFADGLEVIGNSSFAGDTGISSIVLPATVNAIEDWAFYGTTNLASINIPDGITAITEHTFQQSGLTSIVLPASVKSLKVCAFQDASKLASINLENITEIIDWSLYGTAIKEANIKNVGVIHNCILAKCPNLETVTIEGAYSIGEWVFQDSPKLKSVSLGEGLEDINTGAFSGCSSLASITLPNSIFYIGAWALEKTALSSVYVSWEVPGDITIDENAFGQEEGKPAFTWYVPSDLKDTYGDEWLGFPVAVGGTGLAIVANSSVKVINDANSIEVKATAGLNGVISAYTVSGAQVYSKTGQINGTKIALPTGLYIVKVASNEGTTASKVIVK